MNNTSLGTSAQASLTTGSDNTAVGYQAQTGLTSGNDNVAIGSGAQAGSTVTGDSNVAIGSLTQAQLTSGTGNVAIGDHALNDVTSGGYNMAVGSNALRLNVTGGQNVAMGEGALYNVTGSQNVGLGPSAGRNLTSGSTNLAIGYNAGNTDGTTATTATVSNTLMLGAQAQALASDVAVIGSTTSPMSLCLGNYGDQTGSGIGVFALSDAPTAPTSNPSGGGVLYSQSGVLKWRAPTGVAALVDVVYAAGSSSTALTLNVANGAVQTVTLTGNCTFTLSGAVSGRVCSLELALTQDGTGSRTVTWPGSVKWSGGAPTLSAAASAVDRLVLTTYDGGTTWYGDLVGRSYA